MDFGAIHKVTELHALLVLLDQRRLIIFKPAGTILSAFD
jgi:hypothetical protein